MQPIPHKSFEFLLNLSYQECQRRLYLSGATAIVLRAVSGEKVQVPVSRLRTLVTPAGLVGRFRLVVSHHHQTLSFYRCANE